MKILIVAKPWAGGLSAYFFAAMKQMFPGSVRCISTRPIAIADRLKFRRDRKAWWERRRRDIETADCDIRFFIGARPEFRGVKARHGDVLYQTDDVGMSAEDLEIFSRIFVSDRGYLPELAAKLSQPSKLAGVLAFACHPPIHYRIAGKRRRGACFIANRDPKRDPYVARLLENGPRTDFIGNYFGAHPLFWRRPLAFRPAVSYTRLAEVYARYRASLNIHAKVVREGTNLRTFEAAACGVAQVVERRPGIEEYFEPGKEIVLVDDPDEMCARLGESLADPANAAKMAERARRRALAEHTYYHRVATALADLVPRSELKAALSAVIPASSE